MVEFELDKPDPGLKNMTKVSKPTSTLKSETKDKKETKKEKKKENRKEKKQQSTNEIDDLFAKKPLVSVKEEKEDKKVKSKQESSKTDRSRFGDPKGISKQKSDRFTEDGLPIYKWEEMISQTGGDTPDCPFDCQCCY